MVDQVYYAPRTYSFLGGAAGSSADLSLPFITQVDWAVDSVNGNDGNVGTAAAPLKTLPQLARRWGRPFSPSLSAITLALSGSFSAELLSWNTYFPCPVTVSAPTTNNGSGVVSAFTQWSAPSTDAKLTDATTPTVWTSHVGRRVRLTSGANAGAVAWVLKDLGSNQCRVSAFTSVGGALVAPANGDTFVIETVGVQIGGFNCFSEGVGKVTVRDLALRRISSIAQSMYASGGNPSQFDLFGCETVTDSFTTSFSVNAYRMVGTKIGTGGIFTGKGATANFLGLACFGTVTVQQGGDVRFVTVPNFFQNAQLTVSLGGYGDASADIAFFDRAGAVACMSIDTGSSFDMSAKLAGIGNANTLKAVVIRSGGKLTWNSSGNRPTVNSTGTGGGDCDVGGTAKLWTDIENGTQSAFLNPNNGAMAGLRS